MPYESRKENEVAGKERLWGEHSASNGDKSIKSTQSVSDGA